MRATASTLALGILALCVVSLKADDAAKARDLKLFNKDHTWTFANGPEFPGAKGDWALGTDGDKQIGTLSYDFTGGGNYVNAGTDINLDKGSVLQVKVRSSEPRTFIVRLKDKSEQWHQFKTEYSNVKQWDTIAVKVSEPSSEHWGGKDDGVIEFPIATMYLGVLNEGDAKTGKVEFTDVTVE